MGSRGKYQPAEVYDLLSTGVRGCWALGMGMLVLGGPGGAEAQQLWHVVPEAGAALPEAVTPT